MKITIPIQYPPIKFRNFKHEFNENIKVRNTGETLQIDVLNDQEYLLKGGGLPGIYRMTEMHFHWESEHTMNKTRFVLELHIVTYNRRYNNFSEAIKNEEGIAVLGVLFHISNEANPTLENILNSAASIMDKAGEKSVLKEPFSPIQLLPKDRSSYFRYDGSLTNPPCTENVIWIVFDNTLPVATDQIKRFKQLRDEDGAPVTRNFRRLQSLNSRPIYFVRDTENALLLRYIQ